VGGLFIPLADAEDFLELCKGDQVSFGQRSKGLIVIDFSLFLFAFLDVLFRVVVVVGGGA
jgi:hypothetical protein